MKSTIISRHIYDASVRVGVFISINLVVMSQPITFWAQDGYNKLQASDTTQSLTPEMIATQQSLAQKKIDEDMARSIQEHSLRVEKEQAERAREMLGGYKTGQSSNSQNSQTQWQAPRNISDQLLPVCWTMELKGNSERLVPLRIITDVSEAALGGAASIFLPQSKTLDVLGFMTAGTQGYLAGGLYGAENAIMKETLTTMWVPVAQKIGWDIVVLGGSNSMGAAMLGAAGTGALAAGTAVFSYDIGQYYIAPLVAPTLGEYIYNWAPGLFTPPVNHKK